MKKCTKCNNEFQLMYFQKNLRNRDGLSNWCKSCKKEYDTIYRKTDKVKNCYKSSEYLDRKKEYQNYIRKHSPEVLMYRGVKSRAKRFNIPFNIELNDIVYTEYCPLLNIKLDLSINKGRPRYNSPSLDKINPTLGYVKGNIWVISYKANTMKNNATPIELEYFCKNMLKKLNDNNILLDGVNDIPSNIENVWI